MAASLETISIDTDKIHLFQVSLVKGWLDASDEYMENPVKPSGMNYRIGHRFSFNREEKKCRFILDLNVEGCDTADLLLGVKAAYTLDFYFQVENFEDYVIGKGKHFQLHPLFGSTLLGIAFSTARGIVLERTKGTYFDGLILPVVSPMKLLFESEPSQQTVTVTTEPPANYNAPSQKKGRLTKTAHNLG